MRRMYECQSVNTIREDALKKQGMFLKDDNKVTQINKHAKVLISYSKKQNLQYQEKFCQHANMQYYQVCQLIPGEQVSTSCDQNNKQDVYISRVLTQHSQKCT